MQVSKARKGYKLVEIGFGKNENIPVEWNCKKLTDCIKIFGTGDWGIEDAEKIPTEYVRVKIIRNTDFKNWAIEFGAKAKIRLIKKKESTKRITT